VWYFGIVPTVWYFGIAPTVWYLVIAPTVWYFGIDETKELVNIITNQITYLFCNMKREL
jgi:hypothetical protein